MRVALTGTPGTGKTTTAERLADAGRAVVHLNDIIREEGLWTERDDERDSLVADIDAVAAWVDRHVPGDEPVVVESHLAHLLDADRVVILRCDPATLEARLRERPSEKSPEIVDRSARENAESEALDVVLSEAVERHGAESVYEIDTTDLTADETAEAVAAVVGGERDPESGIVDFTDYLV